MGANDAAEMLEIAKEECVRLERQVDDLTRDTALADKHWHRDQADLALIVAERDKAIAELDVALAVIARVKLARSDHLDHPECFVRDSGPIGCGWKRTVLRIDFALDPVNLYQEVSE